MVKMVYLVLGLQFKDFTFEHCNENCTNTQGKTVVSEDATHFGIWLKMSISVDDGQ